MVRDCTFEIAEKAIRFIVPTTSKYFERVEQGIICDSKPWRE